MTTITAQMVKQLRDKTDAGMMACKKALVESGGDMEKAVEHLRKAGMAKAAKKAGRAANQGLIVSHIGDGVGVLAEVLCETDFVAKNEKFREFADAVAKRVAEDCTGDGDVSESVAAAEKANLTEMIATIGENMQIRRVCRWETGGELASYLHMGGKIGVLIDASGGGSELLTDACMHIAAFSPQFVTPEDVPEDVIAKEKEIAAAQVAGKPANIIDKIVMGKLNKWYTETCLMRQPWLRDDKKNLAKVAPEVTVSRFARWQIGEEL